MRREGTKNYYHFDTDGRALRDLMGLLEHAQAIMERLPDREGDE